MRTKFTKHFEALVLSGGAKALRGKGIIIKVEDIGFGTARIRIEVVDAKGKALSYLESPVLKGGDSVTVLKLDQMFNVAFVRDEPV